MALNVARWNLWWPVAAVACTPAGLEFADGGEDPSATETDPTDPTDPSGDPTGDECNADSDCGYAEECVGGRCEYYCIGCCADDPDGVWDFRCSPPPYYDCYSDDECAPDQECEFGQCVGPNSSCGDIPLVTSELTIAFGDAAAGQVRRLAYGELDGSAPAELFGARGPDVLLAGPEAATVLVHAEGELLDVAAGDLDGDGVLELVTSDAAAVPSVRTWFAPAGTFAAGAQIDLQAEQLALGDQDGDGLLDVVARGADVVVLRGGAGGELVAPLTLATVQVDRIALWGSAGVTGLDVGLARATEYGLLTDVDAITLLPEAEVLAAPVGLHAADVDGDGIDDLVAVTSDAGRIVAWLGPQLSSAPILLDLGDVALASAVADIDGDARVDVLVALASGGLTWVYGASYVEFGPAPTLGCRVHANTAAPMAVLAVGDHDGIGGPDVAMSDGVQVTVQLH